jgi:hypothetical protein
MVLPLDTPACALLGLGWYGIHRMDTPLQATLVTDLLLQDLLAVASLLCPGAVSTAGRTL